jgi:multiple sugar transport system ATP-binding protein
MANVMLKNLTKTFGDVVAVDDISVEVKDKEFFVLLGPTGAGKTTTLRLVSGLEKPDKGEMFIDDVRINEQSPAIRDVAFVFQYYTLYPNLTVRQNLEFPLKPKMRKMTKDTIDKKIAEVAKVLHIEHLLDRTSVNLSGGEMQRVAIGRAIVRTPKVFLMDEPLSNLDAKLREEMRAELARLHFNLGQTFFYVTHDQIEAMSMGDRIAVLNEGKILQVGPPNEIYNNPQNMFVARFVGSPLINLFDAEIFNDSLIVEKEALVCKMEEKECSAAEKAGKKKIILGIRPEDIEVSREKKDKNSFECSVYFNQSMGVEDILNLKIADTFFKALTATTFNAKKDEKVYANFNMAKAHLFDSESENRIN